MTIPSNPESRFNDDLVARQVARTSIAKLITNAPTHGLVRDGGGRWAFRAKRGYVLTLLAIVTVLLVSPLGMLTIGGMGGGGRSLAPRGSGALFLLGTGIAFALALLTAWMLVRDTVPAVIDRRRRFMWRSRTPPGGARTNDERWAVPFDEIHALQLLRLPQMGEVHELNVVLHSGRRLHVIAQGGGLVRDAHRIAEVIGVPVWEAQEAPPDKSGRVDDNSFEGRKERYRAARTREIGEPLTFGRDLAAHLMSPSGAVLVLANLGPLIGVLMLDWSVLAVFAVYWLENVVVGVLGLLRLVLAAPASAAVWKAKLFAVPFFVVHYGLFVLLHGWLVARLFGGTTVAAAGLLDLGPLVAFVMEPPIVYTVQALALSHVVAVVWNYLKHEEYARIDLSRLMVAPYARVGLLHIVLLVSALAVQLVTQHGIGLAILVVVKIAGDLWSHMAEHARLLEAGTGAVEGREATAG